MKPRSRTLAAALAVVVATGAASWFATQSPPDRSFIHREGDRLVLRGRTFRFVGTNADIMHGHRERREATRVLDVLTADRINVVRLWALGETDGTEAWRDDYAFRRGPHGWIAASFAHLDRILAALRSRGLHAIVVLANRLGDFGGFPQYLRWAGVRPRTNVLRAGELHRAYSDPAVEHAWREHVRRIVGRTNGVTGVAYRDDPTIMAWELMNEGTSPTCEVGDRMVRWVDRQARFIHGLDANHLVSAGHFGYASVQGRSLWQQVHALDSVDYADHHAYLEATEAVLETVDLAPWMADRVALARNTLHKPLVIGEVGFARDDHPPDERGRWYAAFFDAAERLGVSGVAAWTYQPGTAGVSAHGIFGWGPNALENEPTRAALRNASERLSRARDAPSPRPLRTTALLHEQGPIFAQDAWVDDGDGATMELDPWTFEEACARPPTAWVEMPLWLPQRPVTSLELTLASASLGPLGIMVALDEVALGRLDAPGVTMRATISPERRHEVHWLRLSTSAPRGRALLARYNAELPGADRLTLHAR